MTEQEEREAQGVELKPCPFCGGEPTENNIPAHDHGPMLRKMGMTNAPDTYTVECVCGCGLIDNTREKVISRWNARASIAQADAPRCVACGETIKTGDMVIEDITEGPMHAACCGPDRNAYVHLDDGSPLNADESIPTGKPYYPDTPETRLAFAAGRTSVAKAGEPVAGQWRAAPCEVTREMRYAVWKDQYLYHGATDEQADQLAMNRVEDDDQRHQDERSYRAMLSAAPPAPVGVDAVKVVDDLCREMPHVRHSALAGARAALSAAGIPDTSKDGSNG